MSTTKAGFRLKVEIGIFNSCQQTVNKFDLVVVFKADSLLKYGGPRLNRGVWVVSLSCRVIRSLVGKILGLFVEILSVLETAMKKARVGYLKL